MKQLTRVKSPYVLRMEFHMQGQVCFGGTVQVDELRHRTMLFGMYSTEALEDFCSWMCHIGEFEPIEGGCYRVTALGLSSHQSLRASQGSYPLVPEDFIRLVKSEDRLSTASVFLFALYSKKQGQPVGKGAALSLFAELYGWDEIDLEDFGLECLRACVKNGLIESVSGGYQVKREVLVHLGVLRKSDDSPPSTLPLSTPSLPPPVASDAVAIIEIAGKISDLLTTLVVQLRARFVP